MLSKAKNALNFDQIRTMASQARQLYLGLDCSTQGMKALVTTEKLETVYSSNVNFDKDLPKFQTDHGVWAKDGEVRAPSSMFAAALDLTLSNLKKQGCTFNEIIALSGSGQQHGSIYWKKRAEEILENLDPEKDLESQLEPLFSVEAGPIWMDSSTSEYCKRLEQVVGGPQRVANISGSRAYERFTGNQIQKFFKTQRKVFDNTERISLVSSHLACIFTGQYQPIDVSDASGMNLLDIYEREWSMALLCVAAKGLLRRLGEPCSSEEVLGCVSKYFVERHGFSPNCEVVACTGDNPSSLAGLRVSTPGDVCISLGTSDTLFGIFLEANPGLEGHILCSPIHKDAYMPLLCFKNGSVVREKFRDSTANNDWAEFNRLLEQNPAGNNGNLGFYFLEPEIIPANMEGIHRYDAAGNKVSSFDAATEVRALVESQFLNMRAAAEKLGLDKSNRIIATGGASQNKTILQVISDIFGAPVYLASSGPETATLGAVLRAIHGHACKQKGEFIAFEEICKSLPGSYEHACSPNETNFSVYTSLLPTRQSLLENLQIQTN